MNSTNVIPFRPRAAETPEPQPFNPVIAGMFFGMMLFADAIAKQPPRLPDTPPPYKPERA
jgi:hypothetical protein